MITYYLKIFIDMEMDLIFQKNCSRLLPKFREMKNFATEEVWEDVKGYEGYYQISDMGRVKSLSRRTLQNHRMKERIIALKTSSGYPSVLLAKDGVKKYFDVHRLVAMTFIGNPEKKPMVNH